MSNKLNKSTLEFLVELKENNNREWFQSNKKRYDEAMSNFKQFVMGLIAGINDFDSGIGPLEPADCIFRIYRDVRFSPNKAPYKYNFGAYIGPGGRKSIMSGYYFHIEPESSFISGGIYMAQPEIMRKIREDIYDYSDEFLSIVESPTFKKQFNFFDTDKLKKIPRGFEAGSKVDEFLKMKHITPAYDLSDNELLSDNLLVKSLEIYKTMYPLVAFINRAINQ